MFSFENGNCICTCLLDSSAQIAYCASVLPTGNAAALRGNEPLCPSAHKLFCSFSFTLLLQEALWHNSTLCIEKAAALFSLGGPWDCYSTAVFF